MAISSKSKMTMTGRIWGKELHGLQWWIQDFLDEVGAANPLTIKSYYKDRHASRVPSKYNRNLIT